MAESKSTIKHHPILRLLKRQQQLGMHLVMSQARYNSPDILRDLADALDDGELSPADLEALSREIHGSVKIV